MAINAASAYQDSKILTATPADLTLMLYEGAIKFCNLALLALEKRDYDKVSKNIIKAEKIIQEFRVTLDFKYPVAKNFDVVYDYIYRRLIDANIKKDKEMLEEALGYIREMRDTWKEVMKNSKASSN
ncbi:flagellar export chaperone FliS [Lachnospiraceae bacterium MD1]|uniref:Flagellar secretion chaperone FliS n=2 Tax=Variimorphobacter saccharofermentans TaxID=2755051 RepID=A0A839K4C2_9FIRM|nr:flagellar export chaperone FliS [Variimorphobacter saccharofermentans]MBB2184197.1 flagellar export chaperone FliS [Variimorphobacter saccharofermentans]